MSLLRAKQRPSILRIDGITSCSSLISFQIREAEQLAATAVLSTPFCLTSDLINALFITRFVMGILYRKTIQNAMNREARLCFFIKGI